MRGSTSPISSPALSCACVCVLYGYGYGRKSNNYGCSLSRVVLRGSVDDKRGISAERKEGCERCRVTLPRVAGAGADVCRNVGVLCNSLCMSIGCALEDDNLRGVSALDEFIMHGYRKYRGDEV